MPLTLLMMGTRLNWQNSVRNSVTILAAFGAIGVTAQSTPTRIASVNVGPVKEVYIDRLGDYYLQSPEGKIVKYDVNGTLQGSFLSSRQPTCFDPWNGMKLLLYYKSNKQYTHLDRFMHFFDSTLLDPAFSIDPVLVCSGIQNKLWILDAADWSLKRVNTLVPEVEIDVPVPVGPTPHFTSMREYENLIFLFDPTRGIFIYNILGIPVDSIKGEIPYYNFLGEELYYKKGDQLEFYDLFDGKKRTEALPEAADFALMTDDRIMIVHGDQMDIFRIPPSN